MGEHIQVLALSPFCMSKSMALILVEFCRQSIQISTDGRIKFGDVISRLLLLLHNFLYKLDCAFIQ